MRPIVCRIAQEVVVLAWVEVAGVAGMTAEDQEAGSITAALVDLRVDRLVAALEMMDHSKMRRPTPSQAINVD